ncbi:MAG: hypothetical protein ABI947_21600 [Chloroflexota bacterium]
MSVELHRLLERIAIIMMLTGIIGMFQPWIFDLFGWGFLLLLFSTLAFTIISNIVPRRSENFASEISV